MHTYDALSRQVSRDGITLLAAGGAHVTTDPAANAAAQAAAEDWANKVENTVDNVQTYAPRGFDYILSGGEGYVWTEPFPLPHDAGQVVVEGPDLGDVCLVVPGGTNLDPADPDSWRKRGGALAGDPALSHTGTPLPQEQGTWVMAAETIHPPFPDFQQARNAALQRIGTIDFQTRRPYYGRLSTSAGQGKIVGFETTVNSVWKRFRLDYDPTKGPHIHVEIGKGTSQTRDAYPWLGTEQDFLREVERLQQ